MVVHGELPTVSLVAEITLTPAPVLTRKCRVEFQSWMWKRQLDEVVTDGLLKSFPHSMSAARVSGMRLRRTDDGSWATAWLLSEGAGVTGLCMGSGIKACKAPKFTAKDVWDWKMGLEAGGSCDTAIMAGDKTCHLYNGISECIQLVQCHVGSCGQDHLHILRQALKKKLTLWSVVYERRIVSEQGQRGSKGKDDAVEFCFLGYDAGETELRFRACLEISVDVLRKFDSNSS